jgi:hypothetical protein
VGGRRSGTISDEDGEASAIKKLKGFFIGLVIPDVDREGHW